MRRRIDAPANDADVAIDAGFVAAGDGLQVNRLIRLERRGGAGLYTKFDFNAISGRNFDQRRAGGDDLPFLHVDLAYQSRHAGLGALRRADAALLEALELELGRSNRLLRRRELLIRREMIVESLLRLGQVAR